ncbi:MAG: hypothetical protein WC614_10960 [bacterium]
MNKNTEMIATDKGHRLTRIIMELRMSIAAKLDKSETLIAQGIFDF